eukprot:TRINITY_DN4136_c0_g1_i5.p1 TRINITY_DN4136_c0_g1~~TRINITY_DN4136_c0_g1_i5.p1  ORF type:complete len:460 (-),score=75.67 TRINITY_DN4136_c0_g1_i5:85-1464(-)
MSFYSIAGIEDGFKVSLKLIQSFKRDKLRLHTHFILLSSVCPAVSTNLTALLLQLQKENVAMDYLCARMPNYESVPLNGGNFGDTYDLSEFAIFLATNFVDFNIIKTQIDTAGFDIYFKGLIQKKLQNESNVNHVILKFKTDERDELSPQLLYCSVESHLFLKLRMPEVKICKCHGRLINRFFSEKGAVSDVCSVTHDKLDMQDVSRGYSFGDSALVITSNLSASQLNMDPLSSQVLVKLVVIQICPISSVSEDLLYGDPTTLSFNVVRELDWQTFKYNKSIFHCLCRKLHEKDQGLIARARRYNLKGESIFPNIYQYYLLLPSADGCYFLARPVAVYDYLLPPLVVSHSFNDISREIEGQVEELLGKLKFSNYNPVMFCAQPTPLAQLIKEGSHSLITLPTFTTTTTTTTTTATTTATTKPPSFVTQAMKSTNTSKRPGSHVVVSRIKSISLPGLQIK